MSSLYLSCMGCRIRVRENGPDIDLLEGMCPICGETLHLTSPSRVMGFRLFDLGPLSDGVGPQRAAARPADPARHRSASVALDYGDVQRSLEDGWSLSSEAVSQWPALR